MVITSARSTAVTRHLVRANDTTPATSISASSIWHAPAPHLSCARSHRLILTCISSRRQATLGTQRITQLSAAVAASAGQSLLLPDQERPHRTKAFVRLERGHEIPLQHSVARQLASSHPYHHRAEHQLSLPRRDRVPAPFADTGVAEPTRGGGLWSKAQSPELAGAVGPSRSRWARA